MKLAEVCLKRGAFVKGVAIGCGFEKRLTCLIKTRRSENLVETCFENGSQTLSKSLVQLFVSENARVHLICCCCDLK